MYSSVYSCVNMYCSDYIMNDLDGTFNSLVAAINVVPTTALNDMCSQLLSCENHDAMLLLTSQDPSGFISSINAASLGPLLPMGSRLNIHHDSPTCHLHLHTINHTCLLHPHIYSRPRSTTCLKHSRRSFIISCRRLVLTRLPRCPTFHRRCAQLHHLSGPPKRGRPRPN